MDVGLGRLLWLVGVSLLVVSRIPMRKVHTFSMPPNMVAPVLALFALGVASAFKFPYLTILVIIVAYVIHIPFAVRSKRWLANHPEAWDPKAKRRRALRTRRFAGRSSLTGGRWRDSVCVGRSVRRAWLH